MATLTLMCGTPGCSNEGYAIELELGEPAPSSAVCGVCGNAITDITGLPQTKPAS